DWYVFPCGEQTEFIVDVFTDSISAQEEKTQRPRMELIHRLSQIPLDVMLDVSLSKPGIQLTQERNAAIFRQVKRWLMDAPRSVDEQWRCDEVIITVLGRNIGQPHVACMGMSSSFWVNPFPLRRNIQDKVRKYKRLQLPLVVAVFADALTG